jgi:chromosome segregation ATPase
MKKVLVSIIVVSFCWAFGFSGCAQIEDKVTQIKETVYEVTQTINKLEEIGDEFSKALEEAEEKADKLQTSLDDAEAKLDELNDVIQSVKAENAQLRKEINCLKDVHFAINVTYEWNGNQCTATGTCEICGEPISETVEAVEIEGVLTATFSLLSGFETQVLR